MATYRTEAIVLGARNWGEADKLVSLLTLERGKIQAAAYGSRRPRSALAAGLQMFHHVDAELAEGQRLDTVRQCAILTRFKRLGDDLPAMAYGAFVAELAWELLPENVPEPAVFSLLMKALAAFGQRNPRIVALAAAYQLLERSGSQLSYDRCLHCGKELDGDAFFCMGEGGAFCPGCAQPGMAPYSAALRRLILALRDFGWEGELGCKIKKQELLQAEHLMLAYLPLLIGHPLKSVAFLGSLG